MSQDSIQECASSSEPLGMLPGMRPLGLGLTVVTGPAVGAAAGLAVSKP